VRALRTHPHRHSCACHCVHQCLSSPHSQASSDSYWGFSTESALPVGGCLDPASLSSHVLLGTRISLLLQQDTRGWVALGRRVYSLSRVQGLELQLTSWGAAGIIFGQNSQSLLRSKRRAHSLLHLRRPVSHGGPLREPPSCRLDTVARYAAAHLQPPRPHSFPACVWWSHKQHCPRHPNECRT